MSLGGSIAVESRRGWRIQPLLVLAMSLLVALSIGMLTVIEVAREQDRHREELLERAGLLATVVSQTVADPLYFGDLEAVRHLAETARSMEEVERYLIFNAEGRILVDSSTLKYGTGMIDEAIRDTALGAASTVLQPESEFQVVAPVSAGPVTLGGVVLSVDLEAIAPHARLIINERIRFGGIAVLMGVLLALLLGRWLTAPIRDLVVAARQVASGDLRFSVARKRGGEIGDLVSAFEQMVRRLEERARAKAEKHTAELEKANELLRQYATQDALTGLPNRRLLLDRFGIAKAKARRDGRQLALIFLDLDEFKIVNDSLGHAAGDEVLVELATRLRTLVRQEDTVARLGGDEFVVLITGFDDRGEIVVVAEKILDSVSRPVSVQDREFELTASLGISVCPDDAESLGELLRRADSAMYRAKELGKNRLEFFGRELEPTE